MNESTSMRGHVKNLITYDDFGYLPPEMKISAQVDITQLDVNSKMTRITAKQIMAGEINTVMASLGIKTKYTPEMLSAIAAASVRKKQKAKKKLKKRK